MREMRKMEVTLWHCTTCGGWFVRTPTWLRHDTHLHGQHLGGTECRGVAHVTDRADLLAALRLGGVNAAEAVLHTEGVVHIW